MAAPKHNLTLVEMAQRFGRGAPDPEQRTLDLVSVGLAPPPVPGKTPLVWEARLVTRWAQARTEVEKVLLSNYYKRENRARALALGREHAVSRVLPGHRADGQGHLVEQRFQNDPSRWSPRTEHRDAGQGATGGPSISGTAIVFYDPTRPGTSYRWKIEDWSVEERILPCALRETNTDDVSGLFNHDANYILGRNTVGTLRLTRTQQGLDYSINLGDSPAAKTVLDYVKRRDVAGSSFAFTVQEDSWSEDTRKKTAIREIMAISAIYDVGPVVWPAYAGTSAFVRSKRDRMTKSEIQQELVQILSTW